MLDIADEIDAAIGAPPPGGPAVDSALALGRRALLRRRIAYGVGAAACTLVVAGAAWAVAPGGDDAATDELPVADQSTQADAEADPSSPNVPREDRVLGGGQLAGYTSDGELVIKDGWRVVERVGNPIALEPPGESVGLVLTNGEKTYWYLLNRDRNGSGSVSDEAQKGLETFEEWLALQSDANAPDPLAEALDLRPNGALVSSDPAVEVVDQRLGVDLGAFGPAEDTTVAELRYDGERWFVAALGDVGGGWQLGAPINTPKAGTTLDSAIEYLRAQYDSGEGVR